MSSTLRRSSSFLSFVCLVLALFLSACSQNNKLVGKWQGTEPDDTLEFRADSTFSTSGKEPLQGNYTFTGNSLKLKLDGPRGKALGDVSIGASLEGDTLKMTDKGKTEVYKRAK